MKRAVLAAGNVVTVGPVIIAAGQLLLVELDQNPLRHGFLRQQLFLRGGAVAPDQVVWLTQRGHFLDPADDGGIVRVRRFDLVIMAVERSAGRR